MTSSTSVAVIGAGWAGRVHALAAAAASTASLTSISAPSDRAVERLAADLSVPVRSLDDLPAGAQAIVIATPTRSHADLALGAVAAGSAVMVEGPLTATLSEADRIIAAAEERGVSLAVAVNALFAPAVEALLRYREDAGPLRHLGVSFHQRPPEEGYRVGPLGTGGVLWESGLQCAALVSAVAGDDPVVGVKAALESSRDDGADDLARVELRHRSQLISVVDCSWRADHPRWSIQTASDERVVRAELLPESTLEVDGEAREFAGGDSDDLLHGLGFVAQMEGFTSALAGRGGKVCPAGFGRNLLEFGCAAYASAGAGGDEISLPFEGPRDVAPLALWREDLVPDA